MSDEEGEDHEDHDDEEHDEEDGDDQEAEGAGAIEGAGGDESGSDDEQDKPPPKDTLLQKIRKMLKGVSEPATTYGPPYLTGMPKIDITLIEECDMPEPSVKDVHAILNEGVHPDVVDTNSYNDTAMIKLGRHCYTPESVKILEKLKQAGALLNKCNMLGITPIGRAAMSRPPSGPPTAQRLKFIQWLIDNGADHSPIDKGGFTPMYHAAANGDLACCKVLLVSAPTPSQKAPFPS